MVRIKDLCRWYGLGHTAMRNKLIETGVIQANQGKGGRKPLSVSQLKPFFAVHGTPKELTLQLEF